MKSNLAEDEMVDEGKLRVLEFYSGIGGMRYALQLSGLPFTVIEAFDINEVANDVYEHNFGHRPSEGNVSRVKARELDEYRADMWLMAPPCQPYTRQGLKKDAGDGRATSFLAMLQRIPLLQHPPKYLLVENVVGFETSITHDELLRTLSDAGFAVQEFILSPLQFGIPYSRPRYFCLAKSKDASFSDASLAGTIVRSPAALFRTRRPLRPYPSDPATPAAPHSPDFESKSSQPANASESMQESSVRPSPFSPKTSLAFEHPSCSEPANTSGTDEESLFGATNPPGIPDPSTNQSRLISTTAHNPLRGSGFAQTSHGPENVSDPPLPPANYQAPKSEALRPYQNILSAQTPPVHCTPPKDGPVFAPDSLPVRPVSDFLENLSTSELESSRVPEAIVSRWGDAFDIVTPLSTRCCCFTKSYVKFAKGTGSILATTPRGVWQDRHVADEKGIVNGGVKFDQESGRLVDLTALNLRFFTPREVANFHSFPTSFSFPGNVTLKQQYALLGNSLNAELVACLLSYLCSP